MTRRLTVILVLALGGCAAPNANAPSGTTSAHAAAAARSRAAGADRAGELERHRERVRELEAQLGLAQATSRELRDEVRALRELDRSRATRIGQACAPTEPEAVEHSAVVLTAPEPEPEEEPGPRPVLRLYGAASAAGRPATSIAGVRAIPGPEAPPILAAPPAPGVRLPVSTLGGSAEDVPAIPPSPVPVAASTSPVSPHALPTLPTLGAVAPAPAPRGAEDAAAEEYRAALQHLAERRPADALAGIDAFLQRHPRHPYADNALYWRGEILYVRRDYRRALESFTDLLQRYPQGNKVPDALLRIGLCYRRMGQGARATRVFDRLRAQYPDSVAARMTSQEDA